MQGDHDRTEDIPDWAVNAVLDGDMPLEFFADLLEESGHLMLAGLFRKHAITSENNKFWPIGQHRVRILTITGEAKLVYLLRPNCGLQICSSCKGGCGFCPLCAETGITQIGAEWVICEQCGGEGSVYSGENEDGDNQTFSVCPSCHGAHGSIQVPQPESLTPNPSSS